MAIGNLVTFPQMILSGIFFPIESLPELVQPVANFLPLSFISNGLREIAINGATLSDLTAGYSWHDHLGNHCPGIGHKNYLSGKKSLPDQQQLIWLQGLPDEAEAPSGSLFKSPLLF